MKVKKNPILIVAVVVFVVVWGVWMFSSGMEPIEDSNGPGDYALTTITDENIINMDMGAILPARVSRTNLTIGAVDLNADVEISSDDFSGVYELLYNNYIGASDFVLRLNYLKVNSGNFKMVVVHNDEIVATIEPSDSSIEYWLEDISGYVSLRIAGESADYELSMFEHEYDSFAHPE